MVRFNVDVKNEMVIRLQDETGPGSSILGELLFEDIREQIKCALAHLVSGKNAVFYGAPGTGKTRVAVKICEKICEDFSVETANSEWSNFEIIGGFMPDEKGNPCWKDGIFTSAVAKCRKSLEKGKPYWLVLDELNRANLDLAFGKIFTLLDIDYRKKYPLPTPSEHNVPLGFRILATMNTYDKALLFSLGYAFMRRFAFIQIPSLLKEVPSSEAQTSEALPPVSDRLVALKKTVIDATTSQLSLSEEDDSALLFPNLIFRDLGEKNLQSLVRDKINEADEKIKTRNVSFIEALLQVADCATNNGVEIGQALVMDATKFIVSYYLMFPGEDDWTKIIDEAVIAYVVPQLEYFMPQLRKSEIFQERKYKEKWDNICNCVKNLGLSKSRLLLENAKERFRVM